MWPRNILKRLYHPLRAAGGYIASVVAVWTALLLVIALLARLAPNDVLIILLYGLIIILWFIAVFASSLLFIFIPFYLLFTTLLRLRMRSLFYFVFGGSLAGGVLIAVLLAAGSGISVSGSAFWRAPHWMWVVFFAAGGLSGLVFWLVDIWPNPRRLGRS
jgi:hypothetical protein